MSHHGALSGTRVSEPCASYSYLVPLCGSLPTSQLAQPLLLHPCFSSYLCLLTEQLFLPRALSFELLLAYFTCHLPLPSPTFQSSLSPPSDFSWRKKLLGHSVVIFPVSECLISFWLAYRVAVLGLFSLTPISHQLGSLIKWVWRNGSK